VLGFGAHLCQASPYPEVMSHAPRGILWETLRERALFVAYYDGPNPAERWEMFVAALGQNHSELQPRSLLYALEQPPLTAIEAMQQVMRGRRWRVAFVSPSIAVRFVASTFALTVRDVRFFSPDALPAALRHLECSGQEEQQVLAALERLRWGLAPS
jgi:hypothetical protein